MLTDNFCTPLENKCSWPDNNSYKNHLLESLNAPRLFSVVTWGCCASTWLSKVLDSHPDIFCLHAFNQHYDLTNMPGHSHDLGYMESIAISAHAYQAAGDIHGIRRDSLPLLHEHFQDRFQSAVLVRAPWERFHSMLSCMKRLRGGLSDYTYIDQLIEKSPLVAEELDLADRIFAHSVNMLNAISEEKQFCDTIFRMEDVVTCPEHLAQFIRHVTDGAVHISSKWIEEALKEKKSNSHVREFPSYTSFSAKQKNIISTILKAEALDGYEELGYPVDPFIEILNA